MAAGVVRRLDLKNVVNINRDKKQEIQIMGGRKRDRERGEREGKKEREARVDV
jgi:hypothetical protein